MPFDGDFFPNPEAARLRRNRRQVSLWLFSIAFMIWGMVVLGGATRATGSGLSIMEWAPLSGTLPPLSHAEWERLFAEYRAIPQYSLLHPGMDLAGFQNIFWLEWLHRFWGRLIGVVFLLPLVFFALTRRIERRLLPRLVLFFILGGLQGAVGWFMVSSGFFPDSTSVSAYRLVAHLAFALLLYGAIVATAVTYRDPEPAMEPIPDGLRLASWITFGLASLTILAGGFTAGLHAGLIDNTFPLMDGRLIPSAYAALSPFFVNFFENPEAVQFDHRLLATLTALSATITLFLGLRAASLSTTARNALLALGALVTLQYVLGIATLLYAVPVLLAVLHQANAVAVLTASLVLVVELRPGRAIAAHARALAASHSR